MSFWCLSFFQLKIQKRKELTLVIFDKELHFSSFCIQSLYFLTNYPDLSSFFQRLLLDISILLILHKYCHSSQSKVVHKIFQGCLEGENDEDFCEFTSDYPDTQEIRNEIRKNLSKNDKNLLFSRLNSKERFQIQSKFRNCKTFSHNNFIKISIKTYMKRLRNDSFTFKNIMILCFITEYLNYIL